MKITRYFQSCLLVEDESTRLLIDPSGHEAENLDKIGKLDAVLYTHEHVDHFDPNLTQQFQDRGVKIYANASTAKQIKPQLNVVSDNQQFQINDLKIKAIELPHCLMWDGAGGPQNTGYLVGEKLFHPGDGIELAGLSVDIVALPITGPDISLKDALTFAKQLSAKNVIPIHYDYIGTKPEVFAGIASGHSSFKTHVLQSSESIEL